ncbi:hypothetical protein BC829DRAFT_406394 [Chytridium lagenaria]|nr:hypothetical protein BC829DRAFT_406394 [Chytridium lagenaria]
MMWCYFCEMHRKKIYGPAPGFSYPDDSPSASPTHHPKTPNDLDEIHIEEPHLSARTITHPDPDTFSFNPSVDTPSEVALAREETYAAPVAEPYQTSTTLAIAPFANLHLRQTSSPKSEVSERFPARSFSKTGMKATRVSHEDRDQIRQILEHAQSEIKRRSATMFERSTPHMLLRQISGKRAGGDVVTTSTARGSQSMGVDEINPAMEEQMYLQHVRQSIPVNPGTGTVSGRESRYSQQTEARTNVGLWPPSRRGTNVDRWPGTQRSVKGRQQMEPQASITYFNPLVAQETVSRVSTATSRRDVDDRL